MKGFFYLMVAVSASTLGIYHGQQFAIDTDIQIDVPEVPERIQGPSPVLPGPGLVPVPPPPTVEGELAAPPSPPGGRGRACSSPYAIRWHAREYEVGPLLVKYYGDGKAAQKASWRLQTRVNRAVGCKAVVTYPDSYVPVIISKRRMAEVQQLLGPEICPLTPNLEWSPDGQQGSGQTGRYRAPNRPPSLRR